MTTHTLPCMLSKEITSPTINPATVKAVIFKDFGKEWMSQQLQTLCTDIYVAVTAELDFYVMLWLH